MNKTIIGISVAVIIIGGGILYFQSDQALAPNGSQEMVINGDGNNDAIDNGSVNDTMLPLSQEMIIGFTEEGYRPSDLAVKQGANVTFLNMSSEKMWPASAKHPTHTVYPGSDIAKCGTPDEKNIFDACRGLEQGESYSFTFNIPGEWFYHDHLNPSKFGKITVE